MLRKILPFFIVLISGTAINVFAQNVGIGTNFPVNKLSVVGKVNITDSLAIGIDTPKARLHIVGDALLNGLTAGLGGGNSFYNTVLGYYALAGNTTGTQNTAMGLEALTSNTIGIRNTAIGSSTLAYNTTGIRNTAVGAVTMYYNDSGSYNTGVGASALYAHFSGNSNTAIGAYAMANDSAGNENTAIGSQAMFYNRIGSTNTAVGARALMFNSFGLDNVAIGHTALNTQNIGFGNTAIGARSGLKIEEGYDNTFIGTRTSAPSISIKNATAIGADAYVGASNSIVLGSIAGVNNAIYNTQVGIGVSIPTATLDVNGTLNATSWKDQNLSQNGYAKMGGVIMQWGSINYTTSANQSISFPTAFANVFSLTLTIDNNNTAGATGGNIPAKIVTLSSTNFTVAGTAAFSGDTTTKVRWMAIGN